MSRSDHSKGCPNGRDCGVCSPGKGVEAVLPRDRRRLQDDDVDAEADSIVREQAAAEAEEQLEWDSLKYDLDNQEEWLRYQDRLAGIEDAAMDLWDETLSDRID